MNKRRSIRRRSRGGFRSHSAAPILKLTAAVSGVLLGAALLVFGVMFVLEAFFKVDTPLKSSGLFGKFAGKINTSLVESPTPVVTEEPTPTPHPMDGFDPASSQKELVFPGEMNYPYLADPYCFGGTIVCSAGKLTDGKVKLQKLVSFELASGSVKELDIIPLNDHLIYPVFNEKWLVYFDANHSFGGGEIRFVDRLSADKTPKTIKKVYIGQPKLSLDGDLIAWIERTGSEREKIFVCDLSTEETVTVDFFDNKSSGVSMPSLSSGRLVWSAPASTNDSTVKFIDLSTGAGSEFRPGIFVHDPQFNGEYYAWLDSPHADNTKLYISDGATGSNRIAEDVIEFGLSERFIAYSVEDAVYMYVFEYGETYRLTPENESAQLLGVSDGTVFFMDVTSRERDIIKYIVPALENQNQVVGNEG